MPNEKVEALPRRSGDEFTEVVVRVPDDTMADAWSRFERLMKDSPGYQHMVCEESDCPEFFFEDDELKLLAGAFLASSQHLPMGPYEYVRWVDGWDEELSSRQYVDEFIASRFISRPNLMSQLSDAELDLVAERVPNARRVKAEREEARMRREEAGKRRIDPQPDGKQIEVEKALTGSSVRDVWNALVNAVDGDDLVEITGRVREHLEVERYEAEQAEAA